MMKRKKSFSRAFTLLICLAILVSLLPTAAFAQTRRPISIEFDGRGITGDVSPIIVGGRTLVPMRVIFETLGADVNWNETTRTVSGRKAGRVINLVIGNRTATIDGRSVALEQPAQINNGRTLVPLRFVGEALGAQVEWDSARAIVRISSTDASRRRTPVAEALRLTTGGATFPFPLYTRLVTEYRRITEPAVTIDYASVGSGAGIRGILARTFDFAGTDAQLTDEQMAQVAPNQILHIPTVMGAVAVTYNVSGVGNGLRLTPDVLADIYLGVITRWNDARITALNPGVRLPDQRITVVRRSDSSGTTFIFTDYLSSISERWQREVGRATAVRWPGTTVGAHGNAGVAAQVSQLPGAIGYVELSTAIQSRLNMVQLRNRAGNFVTPTVDGTSAAAAGLVQQMPRDMRMSLVNSPGAEAYPIVGLTWILVYRDQADAAKARAIVDFLRWAVVERNLEPFAADLYYAPLPEGVITRVREQLETINHNGQPILR
ncbi:MAG: phosphate ABC transporter substrate-binding protein PstS [Dethiobacter sp.]|nr:phosphate ABC transporter substrate-binding protein PstS [Dethiobacter sp.]